MKYQVTFHYIDTNELYGFITKDVNISSKITCAEHLREIEKQYKEIIEKAKGIKINHIKVFDYKISKE